MMIDLKNLETEIGEAIDARMGVLLPPPLCQLLDKAPLSFARPEDLIEIKRAAPSTQLGQWHKWTYEHEAMIWACAWAENAACEAVRMYPTNEAIRDW